MTLTRPVRNHPVLDECLRGFKLAPQPPEAVPHGWGYREPTAQEKRQAASDKLARIMAGREPSKPA